MRAPSAEALRVPTTAMVGRSQGTVAQSPEDRRRHRDARQRLRIGGIAQAQQPRAQAPAARNSASATGSGQGRSPPRPRPAAAEPPTVSPPIISVGWPTPTGTHWPFLPQLPMPGSSAMSLPIARIWLQRGGPVADQRAPFTGAPTLPFFTR
jgi:hypothetical protein